jgi:hypothetical protein
MAAIGRDARNAWSAMMGKFAGLANLVFFTIELAI